MLLSVIFGCRLYSSAWSVISVSLDFEGETFILFEWSHCSILLMKSYSWVAAVCGFGCWEKMVMLSA